MGWRPTTVDNAVRLFGAERTRVELAWQCREEPGTLYRIAERLNRSEPSLRSVARTLDDAGAIRGEAHAGARGKVWEFNPATEWSEGLDIAERKMSTGALRPGLRLVL